MHALEQLAEKALAFLNRLAAASPSIRQERTGRFPTAIAIKGKRDEKSGFSIVPLDRTVRQ
jgi:hypothetical protein